MTKTNKIAFIVRLMKLEICLRKENSFFFVFRYLLRLPSCFVLFLLIMAAIYPNNLHYNNYFITDFASFHSWHLWLHSWSMHILILILIYCTLQLEDNVILKKTIIFSNSESGYELVLMVEFIWNYLRGIECKDHRLTMKELCKWWMKVKSCMN